MQIIENECYSYGTDFKNGIHFLSEKDFQSCILFLYAVGPIVHSADIE